MDQPSIVQQEPKMLSPRMMQRLPFSLVLCDPHQHDCPIVYVNDAFTRSTGYSASAVIGRNCRFLQGSATQPEARQRIREALANEAEITVDVLNYRADGSSFTNRLMIAPLHDENGDLLYYIGVQFTRGEETKDEARVRELHEQLAELQHRVKNHLSMIMAMIRLEANNRDPKAMADILYRRVHALTVLYEDFASRDVSKGETIALGAYLSRIASIIHQIDGRADVRLNMELGQATIGIDAASRLGLLLSEILTNAFQHGFEAGQSGEVRVTLEVEDGGARLTVADDGVGMEEGSWPRTDSLGGRIITQLIERLDGSLSVQSKPGEGTLVALSFRTA